MLKSPKFRFDPVGQTCLPDTISRDKRLDSIKGFLIILVVLGHLIGECGTGVVNEKVWTFIYTFHMPLFVLISGYLTKIKDDQKSFWKGIKKIAIPFVVFQVLSILLCVASNKSIGWTSFIVPYWTLWYLISLISWRIILQFSPKWLLNSPVLYLIIAVVVSIFCGLMPYGRILSIQRTLNFYPFFLFGYYMRNMCVHSSVVGGGKLLCYNMLSVLMIFLCVTMVVMDMYPSDNGLLLRGAYHYSIARIPSKIYLLAVSFVTSISFFYLIKENRFLSKIGKDSMIYYLYHGIIIRFALKPIVQHLNFPQSFPFLILYCIIVMVLIYGISKIRIFRWLCNPEIKD